MKIQKILPIILIFTILTGCSISTTTETTQQTTQSLEENNSEKDTTNIEQTQTTTQKQNEDITPVSGGNLNLSMRLPKTLNPLINEDYTVDNILKLIFEPLFIIDETLKPVPNIAESYSISEDGKTLIINMREGITWHNGDLITAKDVVFSLDVIKANPTSIYINVLNKVASYSSKGSQVFIEYIEPYTWAIYNLCFPIIPKNYYQNNLDLQSEVNFKPVGSGSYKFSSYRLANNLILEKTNSFKGTPYIDTINIMITPNKETDLNAFERNITDSIKVDFSEWGKLNFNKEKIDTKINTNSFEFLGFNHNLPLYKNLYFRKAIAYMIPKDEIVQNVLLGSGIKTISPINPISWNSSYEEIENYNYSVEKAIENLALANLNLSQLETTILVNAENEQRIEIADFISKRLERLGLKVVVIVKPFDEYLQILQEGTYHMFLGGIDFNMIPNFESFLTTNGIEEGGLNYFDYQDPKMDLLIGNMYKAIGEQNFLKACKEFEKYFTEQLPLVGLYFQKDILLTDGKVLGEKNPNIYSQYNDIELWHIKQEEVVKND